MEKDKVQFSGQPISTGRKPVSETDTNHQAVIIQLENDLPALLTSTQKDSWKRTKALIRFVEAYADAADYDVQKNHEQVVRQLEAEGYQKMDCVGLPKKFFNDHRVVTRYVVGQLIQDEEYGRFTSARVMAEKFNELSPFQKKLLQFKLITYK